MKPLDHRVLDHPYSDSGEVTIKADHNGHLTHPLDHAPSPQLFLPHGPATWRHPVNQCIDNRIKHGANLLSIA